MRSSLRARNSPPNVQQSTSSSSSLSSARPERSTRSHHKSSPPRKSASPGLLSEDDIPSASHTEQAPPARRSTRQTVDDEAARGGDDDDDADDNAGEAEDDVTRCVCGHQEYPGPPLTDGSLTLPPSDIANDDAGGLFIQCDKCHVWQHGGCVGIMDESKSPENYFCELCDKRLHDVMTDARGQRYSLYLPLHRPERQSVRKSSVSKDKERESDAKARKEREEISRASVDSIAAKRRSTMNSRQAYDEEETLRRVIEESRGEKEGAAPLGTSGTSTSTGTRKGKRSRDDSEDIKQEIKRQRTSSDSPDAPSTLHTTASQLADSDDDSSTTRPTASSLKKARSVAAESQRQKELGEREKMREQQRAEAAGRRKERAGRRRGDDSETIEDTPRPDTTPLNSNTSQPPSPPASAPPLQPSSSHKRGANKKSQKRAGRNQYTKDRDLSTKPVASPNRSKSQPHVQNSSGEDTHLAVVNPKTSPVGLHDIVGPAKARLAKAKAKTGRLQPAPADGDALKERDNDGMSLSDMKKRATLMIEYIAKTQVDSTAAADKSSANGPGADAIPLQQRSHAQHDFKDLTSRDMMDVLTRQITAWQNEYGLSASAI